MEKLRGSTTGCTAQHHLASEAAYSWLTSDQELVTRLQKTRAVKGSVWCWRENSSWLCTGRAGSLELLIWPLLFSTAQQACTSLHRAAKKWKPSPTAQLTCRPFAPSLSPFERRAANSFVMLDSVSHFACNSYILALLIYLFKFCFCKKIFYQLVQDTCASSVCISHIIPNRYVRNYGGIDTKPVVGSVQTICLTYIEYI